MIVLALIVVIAVALCYPIYRILKEQSEAAEKKWEEEDKTIYVRYGKFDIPILQSQQAMWDKMHEQEKFGLLQHLQAEVKGKRLAVTRENGITKFTGITEKAKDIKYRQKQRTEAWSNSTE